MVHHVKVSEKGWIVIPKAMRDRLGIKKGDEVALVSIGGESITILPVPPGDPIERGLGLLGTEGPSMTEGLLADRRRELEQEERDLPPPRRRDDEESPGRRVAEQDAGYERQDNNE